MGLPYKDVNEKNLDEKMKILDRLTKEDFRKFIVEPRPELFDPNYVPREQRKKTIRERLEMKNARPVEDGYKKQLSMVNSVIESIKKNKLKKIQRLEKMCKSSKKKETLNNTVNLDITRTFSKTSNDKPAKLSKKMSLRTKQPSSADQAKSPISSPPISYLSLNEAAPKHVAFVDKNTS